MGKRIIPIVPFIITCIIAVPVFYILFKEKQSQLHPEQVDTATKAYKKCKSNNNTAEVCYLFILTMVDNNVDLTDYLKGETK